MTVSIRILIVEDDQQQIKSWEDAFEFENASDQAAPFVFVPEYAESSELSERLIEKQDFDAAIVDLRLQQGVGKSNNADGNEVVSMLLANELAVVAVFSGEAQLYEPPPGAGSLVKVFSKGSGEDQGTAAIIDWLKSHVEMLVQLRRASTTLKRQMVRLFVKSIWPRWNLWIGQESGGKNDHSLALSRHLAAHVHLMLSQAGNYQAESEEWYFIPPISEELGTGDILHQADGSIEVVITPRCDLAVKEKAITIQLAACSEVPDWHLATSEIEAFESRRAAAKGNELAAIEKEIRKGKEKLRKMSLHSGTVSIHFIPKATLQDGNKLIGPFHIQFNQIRTLPMSDATLVELKGRRVASLATEFLPSMVQRLGDFFSRIGTPNYSQ